MPYPNDEDQQLPFISGVDDAIRPDSISSKPLPLSGQLHADGWVERQLLDGLEHPPAMDGSKRLELLDGSSLPANRPGAHV